jgi:hypothetical protein
MGSACTRGTATGFAGPHQHVPGNDGENQEDEGGKLRNPGLRSALPSFTRPDCLTPKVGGEEAHLGFGFAGAQQIVREHVRARQEHEVIGAAGGQQSKSELHRVLKIDIVVGYAMYDEQRTLQTGGISKYI